MSNEDALALQIEQFHQLAVRTQEDQKALYSQELANWLIEFISVELPGSKPPLVNSPKAFADALHILGRNKRAWSQRLGSLLIELSDSQITEQKEQASSRLDEFIQECPWRFLRESARWRG